MKITIDIPDTTLAVFVSMLWDENWSYKMDDFFKTHELYPEKREGWYSIWKCRKKLKESES